MTSPRQRIELSDDMVTRLRARDAAAYDEIVERVGPSLVDFATQILRSTDAAEDIVQDVFYHMWRQGERFAPKGTVVAYLFTAVRNRALNVRRHEHIVDASHTALAADAVSDAEQSFVSATDAGPEADENIIRLRQVLATLTERQRTAFSLRYDQALSIAEIGEVMGITPKGADQLLTRARQILRERFFASGM